MWWPWDPMLVMLWVFASQTFARYQVLTGNEAGSISTILAPLTFFCVFPAVQQPRAASETCTNRVLPRQSCSLPARPFLPVCSSDRSLLA